MDTLDFKDNHTFSRRIVEDKRISISQKDDDFGFVFLGQSVLRYQVPVDIYNTINSVYESSYRKLPKANPQLVGKIEKEHSLFFDGPPNNKMHPHNLLPLDVRQWFVKKFKHYLDWNRVKGYRLHLNSVWINQMFEHEYNPVHVHQGGLFTGLSSVMILKIPESFPKAPVRFLNPFDNIAFDALARLSSSFLSSFSLVGGAPVPSGLPTLPCFSIFA